MWISFFLIMCEYFFLPYYMCFSFFLIMCVYFFLHYYVCVFLSSLLCACISFFLIMCVFSFFLIMCVYFFLPYYVCVFLSSLLCVKRFAGVPMVSCILWYLDPLSSHQLNKTLSKLDPLWQNFLDPRMYMFSLGSLT